MLFLLDYFSHLQVICHKKSDFLGLNSGYQSKNSFQVPTQAWIFQILIATQYNLMYLIILNYLLEIFYGESHFWGLETIRSFTAKFCHETWIFQTWIAHYSVLIRCPQLSSPICFVTLHNEFDFLDLETIGTR